MVTAVLLITVFCIGTLIWAVSAHVANVDAVRMKVPTMAAVSIKVEVDYDKLLALVERLDNESQSMRLQIEKLGDQFKLMNAAFNTQILVGRKPSDTLFDRMQNDVEFVPRSIDSPELNALFGSYGNNLEYENGAFMGYSSERAQNKVAQLMIEAA